MTLKFTPDGKVDRTPFVFYTDAGPATVERWAEQAEELADALDECVAALRYIIEVAPVCGDDDAEMAARNCLRKIGAEP